MYQLIRIHATSSRLWNDGSVHCSSPSAQVKVLYQSDTEADALLALNHFRAADHGVSLRFCMNPEVDEPGHFAFTEEFSGGFGVYVDGYAYHVIAD